MRLGRYREPLRHMAAYVLVSNIVERDWPSNMSIIT
jgi:hypothetical protein